jgi:transcription initiation factor IIE alpha subunit
MKIKFQCPFCGQQLEAAEDSVGSQTLCPSCKHDIIISAISTSSPATDSAFIRQQVKDCITIDLKNSQQKAKKNSTGGKKNHQQPSSKIQKKKIKFQCPVCGQQLEAAEDSVGSKTKCPSCQRNIVFLTGDNNNSQEQDKIKSTENKKQLRQKKVKRSSDENNNLPQQDNEILSDDNNALHQQDNKFERLTIMNATCPCCGIVLEYESLKKGEIQNLKESNQSTASSCIVWGVLLLPFFGLGLILILMGIFGGLSSYATPKRNLQCCNCGRIFEVPAY